MSRRMLRKHWILFLLLLLPAIAAAEPSVNIVLEESPFFTADRYVCTVGIGEGCIFTLAPSPGAVLTGATIGILSPVDATGKQTLTIDSCRYSEMVSITATESGFSAVYHANGGQRLDGGNAEEPFSVLTAAHQNRFATDTGETLLTREGYTLLGWSETPERDNWIALGSRADAVPDRVLYAVWAKDAEEALFETRPAGEGVIITGYHGGENVLVIPRTIGNSRVLAIGGGAFAHCSAETVVLPPSLMRVEDGAFENAALSTLILHDDIRQISDRCFTGCENLQTLRVIAAESPAYAVSYFATFADKFDRLCSLREKKKLVLFSGSSTRFGYDSAALDAALPAYDIANMGVFAYTNAYPQLLMILSQMQAGDILLHSPEFDAAKRQFCVTNVLDSSFFCMMERNWDMLTWLDLRQCSNVFSAFQEFLTVRASLPASDRSLSPSQFDEDGNPISAPSYNEYGDYIVFRENAADDAPVYGLPLGYTVKDYPQSYLDSLNAMYDRFLQKGIRVLFTYAPRNRHALSEDSTPEAVAALDEYLRGGLCVPVITEIEASLVEGRWLSGTDNHLSTEGVKIRTREILEALQPYAE